MMEQRLNGKVNVPGIVALDMDGTLLNDRKEVSGRNLQILKKLKEAGTVIVPATGRTYSGLPVSLLREVEPQYAICSNGAAVVELLGGRTVYWCSLPKKLTLELLNVLSGEDVILDVFADGRIFAVPENLSRLDEFRIPENMKDYVRKTRVCIPNMREYVESQTVHIEKINLFFRNGTEREKILKKLQQWDMITVTSSLHDNAEINYKDANKGQALSWLASYLDIPREAVMAFGDSYNDLTMLEYAGCGVAMSNGDDAVKKTANRVTLSNEEDGVAVVLEGIDL